MTSTDAAAHAAAEQAAATEIEELRHLTAGAAVGLTRCGRDLRYRSANPAYARLVGVPAERIVGRGIAEVLGEAALERARPWIERVLRGEQVEYEAEMPLAHGGSRFLHVVYMPDLDEEGRIDGWVASVHEITERKRAEQGLLEQKRLLAGLAESVVDAILIVSPDGRMLHHNRRFLEMWRFPAEVVDAGSDERALQWAAGQTADPEAFLAGVAAVYARGDEPVREELHMKDGRVYERCGAPVGAGAARLGWVWTFRDITERKRAEEALQRRNRQLDMLAGSSQALVFGGQDEAALLQSVFDRLCAVLGAELMFNFLVAEAPRTLRLAAHAGLTPEQQARFATVRFGEHLCGRVAERREAIVIEDLQRCDDAEAAALRAAGVRCYAGLPLLAQGSLLGTVAFASRSRTRFGDDELQAIRTVADQVAATLERTRLFERLRASEERLTAVFGSTAVGAALLTPEARFLRVNGSFCRITGYSQEELGALDCDAITHPEDRAQVQAAIEDLVAGRLPTFTVEKRYLRKDGSAIWAQNSVSLVRDAAGRPQHLVALCQDVSERRRSEAMLIEQKEVLECIASGEALEACLRRLTAAVPRLQPGVRAAVVLADGSRSRFAAVHACDIAPSFGRALEGRPIAEDAAGTCSIAIRRGQPADCSDTAADARWSAPWRRLCAAHGIPACHSQPVLGGRGEAVASFLLCLDAARAPSDWERRIAEFGAHLAGIVVERDEQARALRDADRRKDEFLATLAHELRNPLAPLRNGLQVMKLAPDNAEAATRTRAMMERQLGAMVRLIDDLLDLSRVSRGRIDLKRERLELARVLQQAVETSRPVVEAGGHELTIRLPRERVVVDADETRLAQVIANLLNNAAKYTERGGRITLTLECQPAQAVVSVRDTGVGIPPHLLPEVFEMFTQVDRSLERAQGGLGIGLSLVKALVELHGGSVEGRSEGPGRGSEFIVRLPLAAGEAAPQAAAGAERRAGRARRILVADDNRDAAMSLAMMLGLMGHATRTAHDGSEALDLAADFRPEVMLLDIGMPRLSGYDVCRAVRREPWGAAVTLVALTGWGQEEDRRKSREAGFDAHLVKPVDPAALGELIAGR